MKSVGERSFTFIAPSVWNSMPSSLRSLPTLSSKFSSRLSCLDSPFHRSRWTMIVCVDCVCIGLSVGLNNVCYALSFVLRKDLRYIRAILYYYYHYYLQSIISVLKCVAGYAPITGLCNPGRACATITDEGFTSGFIIAHEMAHV